MTDDLPPLDGDDDPAIQRLTKDLREAAATLSRREVRFLVDTYYQFQDNRKRAASQILALSGAGEPHSVVNWLFVQSRTMEGQIKAALDRYSAAQPIGQWARAIYGVGPVISAGLIAHIDIQKAQTVSQIWSLAGLDPTQKWEKGQKRPWNAELKVLCWKLGQAFMKVSNKPTSFYGQLYRKRKAFEIAKNESGERANVAALTLAAKNIGKTTETYKHYAAGHLPPSQIDGRARRYAVKMFLSHFHQKWRELEGLPHRDPYVVEWLGHTTIISPDDVS